VSVGSVLGRKYIFDQRDFVLFSFLRIDGGPPKDHIPPKESPIVIGCVLVLDFECPVANRVFSPKQKFNGRKYRCR